MKLQLAVLVLCGTAFGSAIPVTGSGSFSLDNFFDTYASVCVSGAGVSVCANGIPIGPAAPVLLWGSTKQSPYMQFSAATVDGITSHLYTLSVGGESGFIQTLDNAEKVLTSEEICGLLQITSYEQSGTRWLANGMLNDNWWARGTFIIGASAVPEAGSGVLLGLGLAVIAIGIIRNRAS